MPRGARRSAQRSADESVFPMIPGSRPRVGLGAGVLGVVASFFGAIIGGVVVLAVADGDDEPPVESAPAAEAEVQPDPMPSQDEDPGAGVDRVAGVAEAVLPTVVRIDIENDEDSGDGAGGNGSGVVYSDDGHIVTNNHVVAQAEDLTVVFADGTRDDAKIVGTDALNDLAVVQVDRDDLPSVTVGEPSSLRVGELAVAIGSPFGLEGSVTSGVISALDRGIDVVGPGGSPLTLPRVIQTDAPINPGNSGGPLVNGGGELIGINSAILTSGQRTNAGVGFAIPVDTVVQVSDALIANGYVSHPFLGVEGETVEEERAAELDLDGGAEVRAVRSDTPAAEAGLEAGDIVIGLDGADITTMDELVTTVLDYEVGDEIVLTYVRDGDEREAEVELAERPPEDG